jgi:hypothetical protein
VQSERLTVTLPDKSADLVRSPEPHILEHAHQFLRGLVWLILLSLGSLAHAGDPDSVERQKIDYLIATVETLQGAQFVRNGNSYDAKAAADHLRLKLRLAGSRIKTAEDFIRFCASGSSISGTPYQIRFADGRIITSEAYLRQKLAKFATENPEPQPAESH